MDVAALNGALGEKDRNLVLFDKLPAGDPRREGLLVRVYDQLIADRRYSDAAAARPFSKMISHFELAVRERPLPANITNPEAIRSANRRYVATTTARNIEVLAGAGDVAHAQDLAQRLLAFDRSEETMRLINEHAARAGHPDLLTAPAKP